MPDFKKLNVPGVIIKGQDTILDILRLMKSLSLNLDAILNRGIRPEFNLDARLVTVVSDGTPGVEFSVAHGLGKTPVGYKVYGQNGPGSVYDGTTGNDKTTLYLRSSAATTLFRLEVF
jgi:hypothetical protein